MSKAEKFDVCLLGNVVQDTILYIDRYSPSGNNVVTQVEKRKGGLYNMIPTLKGLRVKVVPSAMASSTIVVDKTLSSRTSYTSWGIGSNGKNLKTPLTRWCHIAYIDVLEDLNISSIREKADVLSADLCLTSPSDLICERVYTILPYLDYIFISTGEVNRYGSYKPIGNYDLSKTKQVIHSVKESFIVQGNEPGIKIVSDGEHIDGVDTVGAGDAYAAGFISAKLAGSLDKDAILLAHSAGTQHIKRINK
jgi:hypothetical protein